MRSQRLITRLCVPGKDFDQSFLVRLEHFSPRTDARSNLAIQFGFKRAAIWLYNTQNGADEIIALLQFDLQRVDNHRLLYFAYVEKKSAFDSIEREVPLKS